MTKILYKEKIISDLKPMKKFDKEINTYIIKERYRMGDIINELEFLDCGHVNNIKLPGRITGKCPKGCN